MFFLLKLLFFTSFTVSTEKLYDSNFLLSQNSQIIPNLWLKNWNSLFIYEQEQFIVFYNFSDSFYQNQIPFTNSLNNLKATNISNQDSLVYFVYDDLIEIFSYESQISNEILRINLKKSVMEIGNKRFLTFSNISEPIIFELLQQEIGLSSDFHTINSQKYSVFFNKQSDFTQIQDKILNEAVELFIYFPFYINNTLKNLEISLLQMKEEMQVSSEENQQKVENHEFLAKTFNYSLFLFKENKTVSLISNTDYLKLNYYHNQLPNSSNSSQKAGWFIHTAQEETVISFIIMIGNDFLLYNANFVKGYLHFLGQILINDRFSVQNLIDSPNDGFFTIMLSNKQSDLQEFLLIKAKKDDFFQRGEFLQCEICTYNKEYLCKNPNNDCSAVLSKINNIDSGMELKTWISILISIFGTFFLVLFCCFIVQRYCIGRKIKPRSQINNFDEVEERLKTFDKKKIQDLMRKYSITVVENNMEKSEKFKAYTDNKCPICMELLPSQPITYFACKTHIVHTKCLLLYEEENHCQKQYKCPFRCE